MIQDVDASTLNQFIELFESAFDELHGAVVRQVGLPGQFVGPHADYPNMSQLDSGFPSFQEVGYFSSGPKDYVGTVKPDLVGLLAGIGPPKIDFPMCEKFRAFVCGCPIRGRFKHSDAEDSVIADWRVETWVRRAVERYIHVHGISSPIVAKKRDRVILPIVAGVVLSTLKLSLVVPIVLTRFDVDHFRLSATMYITRIPKGLQLARARIGTLGSGATDKVVGAATHAFVATDWSISVDRISEVDSSLSRPTQEILELLENFFGSLRIVSGVKAGFAQILWVPRGWALSYYCDLPPVYGFAIRKYPQEYDDYGWSRSAASVDRVQLLETRRIFQSITNSRSEAIRLAVTRLNGCLTRVDAADAILDGIIGLEILLGDDRSQSLSYKLRLRAAALAILDPSAGYTASAISSMVKRLYAIRSAMVHGSTKKRARSVSKSINETYADERRVVSDLLRFVIDVLLKHPEYLDPARIDQGILLRADQEARTS